MKTLQSVRGMNDVLPADTPLWQSLESLLSNLFAAHDYHEIRIPVVERSEVYTRAIGQATEVVEKEMYLFQDRNGDELCLRPEGTAGVVRAALQHGLLHTPGLKVWYRGPMFRYERPQRGRQREFYQYGAEAFGLDTPATDVELIALGERIWKMLGLKDRVRLEINSLGDRKDREHYRGKLLAYLEPLSERLDEDSRRRLRTNPLRIFDSKNADTQAVMANAPRLVDELGPDARAHFSEVKSMLDALGIAYRVNPGLVRGLDYYCRTVFEWITKDLGAQGTVCAGGRYDDLVEILGGRPTAGIGFALGADRVVELLGVSGRVIDQRPHAYIVSALPARHALALAEEIREDIPGLRVAVDLAAGSFKSQFKRADRSGARYALVLGDSELEQDNVLVKDLRGEEGQKHLARSGLKDILEPLATRRDDG